MLGDFMVVSVEGDPVIYVAVMNAVGICKGIGAVAGRSVKPRTGRKATI
jgi:hypothetical protein